MVRWPVVALGVITLLGMVYEVIVTYHGIESSRVANHLSNAAFSFAVACWVEVDRRRYALSAPFEYAAFVFFLWPVLAPYHLIKTRGWKWAGVGLGLILISQLPFFAAWATYLVLGE